MKTFRLNKRGQTGETISWIVATVIIFVILMFFVLGASLLGGTKEVVSYRNGLFFNADKYVFNSHFQKSIYSYFNTEDSDIKADIKEYFENKSYDFDESQKELRRVLN